MKKIKLYELFIEANDEFKFSLFDKNSLFNEGFFYKEWLKYTYFSHFKKEVFSYLDNMKVVEIEGFADQDHLFVGNAGYGYELLPKCYEYYDKRKLRIPSSYSYALFTRLEYAVDYKKTIEKDINFWLIRIKEKENSSKSNQKQMFKI